jgi:hypothetical protein
MTVQLRGQKWRLRLHPSSLVGGGTSVDRVAVWSNHVPGAAELGDRLTKHLVRAAVAHVVVHRVPGVNDLQTAIRTSDDPEQAGSRS